LWQDHFGKPGRRGYHNHEWSSKMEAVGLMPTDTGQPGGRRVGERVTHMIISGGRFDVACAKLITNDFSISWFDRYPPDRPAVASKPTASGKGFVDDIEDDDGDRREGSEGDDGNEQSQGGMSQFIELPPVGGRNKSNRAKYRCSTCTAQLWGKPGMWVYCGGRTVVKGEQEEVKRHDVKLMEDVTYLGAGGNAEEED
jgi:DNA-directed RNA polymerase subunit RPC12/RpoP